MIKTQPYDSAEFLTTPAAIEAYMSEALETGDAALIAHALGAVARAKSMTAIARKTGLSRASLYRALAANGHPELETVLKVFQALNLKLSLSTAQRTISGKAGKVHPISSRRRSVEPSKKLKRA